MSIRRKGVFMEKKRKVWIISGESSGDLYGARLAQDLWKKDPAMEISGMGGVRMRSAGVNILVDSTELGVIGIVEVLGILFKIIRIGMFLLKKAKEERPDAVILIDYPGFNIRLAKRLKKMNIPVIWYISPQVWVWHKSNIPRLAAYCTKMMVIFPFEVEVYRETTLDVEFVGHPLVEIVEERQDPAIVRDPAEVVLLPGSRKGETSRLFEPMLQTALALKQQNPSLRFSVAATREKVAHDLDKTLKSFLKKNPAFPAGDIQICVGQTSKLLQRGGTGLAASGTVTVECALAGLPLVVIYKVNYISLFIAWFLIRKLFRDAFTMPNIILYRKLFEEYLQWQVKVPVLTAALKRILPGGERRTEVEEGMKEMKNMLLTGNGSPCECAAQCVLSVLDKKHE